MRIGLAAVVATVCSAPLAAMDNEFLNPFQGRQERAKTFAFAEKPVVERKGDSHVIRFATTAACDTTVTIVDKDGTIVRHLASGVLGKNAPWPFKQGALEQTLVWDGKDDRGEPMDASTCKVKIGLGLKATLDGLLGWAPGNVIQLMGIAVDVKGRLVVLGGRAGHPSGSLCPSVRLFDRDGQYLRRLIPTSPLVRPERSTLLRLAEGADGWPTVRLGQTNFQFAVYDTSVMRQHGQPQTPTVMPDGRFVFINAPDRRIRKRVLFFVDLRDGATPEGSRLEVDPTGNLLDDGHVHMTVSRDGKWLYVSSPYNTSRRRSRHAVFRVSLENPGAPAVFAGEPGKAGGDAEHLSIPLGVACDGRGNVYVADSGNDRVQVFDPSGTLLRTLPTASPRRIAVNPKTGDVYVTRQLGKASRQAVELAKISGGDDPTRTVLAKALSSPYFEELLAADFSGDVPLIWLATGPNALHRYEDRDGELVRIGGNICAPAPGWGGWDSDAWHSEIVADPHRNQLYVRTGPWLRVVGPDGRVIGRLGCGHRKRKYSDRPVIGQIAVSPDRMLVMRLSNNGKFLTRYDPDEKAFIGFPGNPNQGQWKTYPGIAIPNRADPRGWVDQMGVAPNGDIYVPSGALISSDYEALKKAGMPFPDDSKYKAGFRTPHSANLLKVFSKDGRLKCISALPGMMHTQGIRIGRNGEVYAVMPCKPVGSKGIGGTLIKFDSRFDRFPVGRIQGTWGPPATGKTTHRWGFHTPNRDVHIDNMAWDYHGVMPVAFGVCQCPHSLFSLDGFDRVFLPAAHKCAVDILDANGNLILSLGGYGNADCRGDDSPVLDPETGELRPRREDDPDDLKSPLAALGIRFLHPNYTAVDDEALYVNDMGNERIVRAALHYHVEETVDLP